MGVYIRLNTEGGMATVRERIRARIEFGGQVWKTFEGFFYPSSVEIWRTSTLEELGGRRLVEPLELDPKSRSSSMMETIDGLAKKMAFEDLFYSIILVKGIWHIDNRSLTGQISINNAPTWRRMYSDIEIDGDTRTEDEDFADVILQSSEMGEGFVRRFIEAIADYQSDIARLAAVYFFNGPMTRSEIYNAKSVYYQSVAEYVSDSLITYRTELSDREERGMLSHLSPYRARFLVSELMKNQRFQNTLRTDLAQSQVLEVKGNSILFLGRKRNSFRQAYELLKKDAFEKMARKLRPAEVLGRDIDNALGVDEQTGIDEDEDS